METPSQVSRGKSVSDIFCTFTKEMKRFFCNFQVLFFVGMTILLEILLSGQVQYNDTRTVQELGDILYNGKTSLKIRYIDYAKSVVYKLAIEPTADKVNICDGSSFKVHDAAGLTLHHVGLFQTLGDTNIHAISAYLDDRLPQKFFIRVLGAGLHHGPGRKIFCTYDCASNPVKRCSVPATAVMLLAGNHTDYTEGICFKIYVYIR